jgi:hypothetical protein
MKKLQTREEIKLAVLFFLLGAIAIVLIWFQDRFINFLAAHDYYNISNFLVRLTNAPSRDFIQYPMEEFIFDLVRVYRIVPIFIFAFMLIRVALFYKKSKNRRASVLLSAMIIFFIAAQFHVPIINYKQHESCPFESRWNQEILENLNEPSLFYRDAAKDETIYRIISTGRAQQAVRIHINHTKRTGIMYFTFFATDNETRTECEDRFLMPLRMEETFPLDSAQYRELKRLFSRYKFWRTPSSPTYRGHDGYTYRIEGLKGNKYHIVERWCPMICNAAYLGEALFARAFSLLEESPWNDKGYVIMR